MDVPTKLDRYADLIVRVGVNLAPEQRLVVTAPIVAAPLARRITAAAYRAGAPYVTVRYVDDEILRIRYLEAPDGTFEEVPLGQAEALEGMAERGDAFVSIVARDPEALAGTDPSRVAVARAAGQRAMKGYASYTMSGRVAWTVAAASEPAWAAKVFPEAEAGVAERRLWEAIFAATRVEADDPQAAWREHTAALVGRARSLTEHAFDALHVTGPGTDLTIGLPAGHVWIGGGNTLPDGRGFVPNLPTEEVFTAPHAERVDGTVRASLPLAFSGEVIDGLAMDFEAGRVVAARAETGQEVLDRLLATDDGARRLGEVALVSVDSPIYRSGRLFYNTLFDENAASHIALGRAYRINLEGGTAMSDDEAAAAGLNDSLAHVDFMIGTPETDVDGIRADGEREAIMRDGRFVDR